MEKLIAHRTTLSSNNQVVFFFIYDYSSLSHRCLGSFVFIIVGLFLTTLFQFIEDCRLLYCISTALLRLCQCISIGLSSGLCLSRLNTLILSFISHFAVDLLVCVESWVSFTLDPRILWYTEELMIDSMTSRCPGGCKTSLNPHPSTTVLDGLFEVFGFCQTWHCALWPNSTTLALSVQKIIFLYPHS